MVRSIADVASLERVPLEQRLTATTVPALVRRGAARGASRPALRFLPSGRPDEPETVMSYGELVTRMDGAARLFRALDVGQGDPVALLLPNVPDAYVALLGAMTAGIAMPMNWMLRPPQIEALLRAGRPKVLVALGDVPGFDIREKVDALPAQLLDRMTLLQVDGAPATGRWTSFPQALAGVEAGPSVQEPSGGDVAAYIHTGGATGQPKMARVLHRAIAYKCWAYAELLEQRPEHVALGVSPLFHVGGIVLRAIHPLSCGMSIVVPGALGLRDRDVLHRYWQIVERKRVTELSAVPTSLGVLADIDPGAADLSSLRPFAITGSSTLPAAVARRFEQRVGVRLLCDYGLTEYTATVALPPPKADVPQGSCGLRLPYTQVRVARVSARGEVERNCAQGEIGEVLVRGPGLAGGYLDSTLDAGLFVADGWARTGDLGRMDGDGFLWITGRAKDVIIRGGHNIDPRVIEETLQSHDAVALVAAVGRIDAYAGELPVAYVQLKKGSSVSAEALKAYARERIPERAAAPVAVHLLDELPLTGAGKVAKPLLREMSACAVIADVVGGIPGGSGRPGVNAGAHPAHGTVYTVTLPAPACGPGEALVSRIREALEALPCTCELRWNCRDVPLGGTPAKREDAR